MNEDRNAGECAKREEGRCEKSHVSSSGNQMRTVPRPPTPASIRIGRPKGWSVYASA
jgi:hypothetical protein